MLANDLSDVIEYSVKAQLNEHIPMNKKPAPILIWGPPGIGKSQIPHQIARKLEIGWIDARPTLMDPSDLRGIPMASDGKAVWLPPSFLPRDGAGILAVDELPSAPPLTQAAFYQLILDRMIGEYHLPDKWYIIAMGNRLEDRAVSFHFSTALASRFQHYTLDVNVDAWIEWAIENGINPSLITFIKFRGLELLMQFDPKRSEKAYACPRTIEFVSRAMTIYPNKLLESTMEATVGKGWTAEFAGFLRIQNELPNIDLIFRGENYVPTGQDKRYALIGLLATRAKTKDQYSRMVDYSNHLPAEFAVLLMKMLVATEEGEILLQQCPNWIAWVNKHKDIF